MAPEPEAPSLARDLIGDACRAWDLPELLYPARLVMSELVTNAVRYAQGQIGLRLVLEGTLFVEVLDDSAALPRLRYPGEGEERGRGLQVISQIAQRWGARRAATGKIVWCELALPNR